MIAVRVESLGNLFSVIYFLFNYLLNSCMNWSIYETLEIRITLSIPVCLYLQRDDESLISKIHFLFFPGICCSIQLEISTYWSSEIWQALAWVSWCAMLVSCYIGFWCLFLQLCLVYYVPWFYSRVLLIAECFVIPVPAFVDLVHSSNGTTQREADYGIGQDHEPKATIRSSRKRGKKNVSAVPSHFVQTDVSHIKGETSMFSSMVFCILIYDVKAKIYSGY